MVTKAKVVPPKIKNSAGIACIMKNSETRQIIIRKLWIGLTIMIKKAFFISGTTFKSKCAKLGKI